MPHAQEKGITRAKAPRVSKIAELIDLYGDVERRKGSLDHAASLALTDLR
jgi:hypothetical protein